MSKQQSLKPIRDYNLEPRRNGVIDLDHRGDLDHFDESRTKQADAESADINNIMAKYVETGQLPQMIRGEPSYGDFSDVGSFQEALEIVSFAKEQFDALPAKTRARFENDPAQMLEFVNNPANAEEMVKLGLAVQRVHKETPEEILKGIRDNTKPKITKRPPDSGASSDE